MDECAACHLIMKYSLTLYQKQFVNSNWELSYLNQTKAKYSVSNLKPSYLNQVIVTSLATESCPILYFVVQFESG